MDEGLTESQKPEVGCGDVTMIQTRTDFRLARRPCSPLPNGDVRHETVSRSSDPSRHPAFNAEPLPLGGKSDGVEVFENGVDAELGFEFTFRTIGAGLMNLGNTCFLNSVLQCLTYTEPFAAYLQSGKHKTSCQIAGFCAMCAIQKHVMLALQSTGKIVAPYNLVNNLRCISGNFHSSRQEDAHEYMVNLLESMHRCCLPSGFPSESPNAYEKSLVHKIFGGFLRSQVKCMQCSYSSNKFDPFLDLSLEIGNVDSLWNALKQFTAVEQLDGGERQYHCQHCKDKVRATKQLTIEKAPYVLTIHLKRFDSYVPGQKIDKSVDFETTIDLEPFVSDPHGGDLKYTLYGVLVHVGWSTESGHYHCYVRTSTGIWHSLDDNEVYQASEQTVLKQKAYILFYVRDRNSIVKKSVDLVQRDNVYGNAPVNELNIQSDLVSKGIVLGGLMDGKRCTSESSLMGHNVVAFEGEQTNKAGNLLSVGGNVEVKLDAFLCLPNDAGFTSEKVLNQPSMHEDGDPIIAIHENDETISNEENTNILSVKRPLEILNQSGCIEKTADLDVERCSTDPECHGEDLLKLEEPKSVDELKTTASGFAEKCVLRQNDITNPLAAPKTKKSIKKSLTGIYFSHKQLFVSSVITHKIRKRNRRKKQTSLNKIVVPRDLSMNDQETSTSEATENVVFSECSGRKRSFSSFNNNRTQRVRTNSQYNCVFSNCSGQPGQSRRCLNSRENQCKFRDKNSNDCSLLQHSFINLLTRGLDQTTVASWDNMALPENSRNSSIGYTQDEWNEEHARGKRKKLKKYRGKRKKLKKSTYIFGKSNDSQETPIAKSQENLRMKKRRLQSLPQKKLKVKRRLENHH
ncbi:ubiquitin carboxyl-terminal hydrolase 42-like [Canna indica]|uniref:Ubiquitin carboxyl-terminal hydrolase n=1 Tax=Canna indica TaxID=4628 RepID=A0AAQ3Q304_9LILI|nr:ubiquitin carboxyl-terminal hydrolase 42-like [Canna indica]